MTKTAVVLTLLTGAIFLTPAMPADDRDDRVARVSYVGGDVSYQRGDDDGWNDLRTNTPLVTGDSCYAGEGGRAELDLGVGVVVRLDGGTELVLVNNSRDVAQLSMTSGTIDIRARSFREGFTLEIDTPTGAVTILEPGRYRVEVNDRASTYSVVRGGMSLALDGDQLDVHEGESLELENGDTTNYAYGRLGSRTPFYSWADDRDSRYERSESARYVNRDVVGYEDLDDHGSWRDSSGYGRVWVPSGMSQGWAPYQSGRWIWQDPYGWTWVSAESWGWAPYHYGRWIYAGNTWCWVPPPPRGYRGPAAVMNIQPVYAPALVAFVGGRNWGVSLSIGGPAIGWVPLAPAERYYYPWQPAPRVTNNYTNITVINAVTVVNYNTFATTAVRPIRVERAQLERAPALGYTAVGVAPTRASLAVSPGRSAGSHAAPRVVNERPVVARLVPPPKPQPFAQKVVEIEKSGAPVARPVAIGAAVGKPFTPGAQAPAGVKPFLARTPGGSKELKARAGAEARPPKRIERDIAPPPPAAKAPEPQPAAPPPVRPEAAPAPTPVPAPRPGNGEGGRPQGTPNEGKRNERSVPPPAAPAPSPAPPVMKETPAVDQTPVRPAATPTPKKNDPRNGHRPETDQTPPVTQQPNSVTAPPVKPAATPVPNNDPRNHHKPVPEQNPQATQQPNSVTPPPVKPAATPVPKNDPRSSHKPVPEQNPPATQQPNSVTPPPAKPQDEKATSTSVPKGKKPKAKKAPEPPPEPAPAPPPNDDK